MAKRLAFIVSLCFVLTSDVRACVCVCEDSTLDRKITQSAGIVLAKVVKISPTPESSEWVSSCGEQMLTLQVVETIKGTMTGQVTARHSNIGTGCDFKFKVVQGETYILFLVEDQKKALFLDSCSPASRGRSARLLKQLRGSRALAQAKREIAPPN
jgi:hypothetical protein